MEAKSNILQKLIGADTIFNLLNDALIVVDCNDQIVWLNQSSLNLFEVDSARCVGKNIKELYSQEIKFDESNVIRNITALLNEKRDLEKNITKSDGKSIKVIEKRKDFLCENNKRYTLIILSDVTQYVQIEEKALRSSNQYLKVLENFPALIWRTNEKGEFNYFNQTWLEFTNTIFSENINKEWFNLLFSEDKKVVEAKFMESFENRNPLLLEFRIKNKNENYSWLLCRTVPYYGLQEEFKGFIGVCIDITDRVENEKKLKDAMFETQKANQAKSTFLSNMSHELRTPLNGILGMTEVLLDSNPTKKQKEFLAVQKSSATSLLNIINSILDLAKIESGNLTENKVEFDLRNFIYEFTKSQKLIITMKGLRLETSINSDLPETLISDEVKLRQIFTNLVGNSVKYTNKGKISIQADFYKGDSNFICFEVRDTGIGIEKSDHEKIFKSFQQVDNSFTRKFDGTGLGLAICKEFVELLGGQIWIKSEIGVGTSFYFTIPCKS